MLNYSLEAAINNVIQIIEKVIQIEKHVLDVIDYEDKIVIVGLCTEMVDLIDNINTRLELLNIELGLAEPNYQLIQLRDELNDKYEYMYSLNDRIYNILTPRR